MTIESITNPNLICCKVSASRGDMIRVSPSQLLYYLLVWKLCVEQQVRPSHCYASLIHSIHEMLRRDLHAHLCHINREGNQSADLLPMSGQDGSNRLCLWDPSPRQCSRWRFWLMQQRHRLDMVRVVFGHGWRACIAPWRVWC